MSNLCIRIRWLDERYHGQNADRLPEWPPSPFRLFQAMLAGICRRDGEEDAMLSALRWIETQSRPHIVAPPSEPGCIFTRFVPDNDSDRKFDRQERLTAKPVCPTLLLDHSPIHYLWPLSDPLSDEVRIHVEAFPHIARGVVALGWGVDITVGDAALISEDQADALEGERWLPSNAPGGDGLRVPREGTLNALIRRYETFLDRLGPDGFTEPDPLSSNDYDVFVYRRATDPPVRSIGAFSLLKNDASGFRPFDTARRSLTVAGLMRHAAKLAARRAGWTEGEINSFVLGHREPTDDAHHVAVGPERFAYLPLPSIEGRGAGKARVVGSIRRVVLTVLAGGCDEKIAWARRALSGQELIDEATKEPIALLSLLPATDKIVDQYTRRAASWATVTPVVLPGYDDPAHYRRRMKRGGITADEQKQLLEHLEGRVDGLLRKAITQAGFSQVLADHVVLEWRKVGYWPGGDLASRYGVPDHLRRFPRFHVRLEWRDAHGRPIEVHGPICLGGGRYFGLGLFASVDATM
jgi:CRISPR-associated protein Csb2